MNPPPSSSTDEGAAAAVAAGTVAPTTSTRTTPSGQAGRCNYDKWEKVTRTLVSETDQEEQEATAANAKALGLDGKYAHSQADAEERSKQKDVFHAKAILDKYQQREFAVRTDLKALFGPVVVEQDDKKDADAQSTDEQTPSNNNNKKKQIVRITREWLDAGKRVVAISDTSGRKIDSTTVKNKTTENDTIVLTSDLSSLESRMKTNATTVPKQYPDDAENDVVETEEAEEAETATTATTTKPKATSAAATAALSGGGERKIYGVIKCFITNVHHCTILIKCKVISGTIELSHCTNVVVQIEKEATVATLQIDLCENIAIVFNDAPSGKNGATNAATGLPIPDTPKTRVYWGQDKDDRIFHAGVKNMTIQIKRDGYTETEHVCDYLRDQAHRVGNATAEEYQFVTSCLDHGTSGEYTLVTESVLREGSTTGSNARPLTKREIEEAKLKREKAGNMAEHMAENMFKFQEVTTDGVTKKVSKHDTKNEEDADVVVEAAEEEVIEEIYASMSNEEIDGIVKECEQNKTRGNEAFGSGEYAQAVLLYSLALDKAAELPDSDTTNNNKNNTVLFARDVVLSNRAAAFLKLGQHEKAADDAKEAYAKYNSRNVKAYFRHGLALHAMKQYADAIPILARAHKFEPNNKAIKEALQFAEMRYNQELRQRGM